MSALSRSVTFLGEAIGGVKSSLRLTIKRYYPPAPPVERVLAHPEVAEVDKELLRAMLTTADPVMLFTGIRAAQEDLGTRVDRRGVQATPQEPVVIDLQRFTANLKTAWQGGEVRPTHKGRIGGQSLTPRDRACLSPMRLRFWHGWRPSRHSRQPSCRG